MIRTRTTSDTDKIPADIAAAVEAMRLQARVPGLSIAVVDASGVQLAAGFGDADLSREVPASASTPYLWFSMSKIVTATAALRLADEGHLDLDAPVTEHLDHLRAPGPRQPTVRHLLTHTSGLGNPMPIRWVHPAGADAPDPAQLLRRLMSRRRAYRYPLGTARYSNVGYLAIGEIIATAAGEHFDTFVRRSVLDPLGMRATGFEHGSEGVPTATGYVRAPRPADPVLRRTLPAGIVGRRHGRYLALNDFAVDGPAYGGLIGTVRDAARFLQMHLQDGELDGARILAPESARAMRRLDHPGKEFVHGLGWFRRPSGRPSDRAGANDWVEHFGAGAGFWNVMRLYPDRGFGVVVMSNSTTSYPFDELFALLERTRG